MTNTKFQVYLKERRGERREFLLAAVNFLLELESEMFLMNIPGKWRRPLFLDLTCETFFSSTEIMTLFMRYLKRQSLSHVFVH